MQRRGQYGYTGGNDGFQQQQSSYRDPYYSHDYYQNSDGDAYDPDHGDNMTSTQWHGPPPQHAPPAAAAAVGGGGGRHDDSDVEMSQTIMGATFQNALGEVERPTEKGRHAKIWRRARRERKIENTLEGTNTHYRDMNYGEEPAGSSDEEGRQQRQQYDGREQPLEEEEESSADEPEDMVDCLDAYDPRKQEKLRKREQRRQRKERKKTQKLTQHVLREVHSVNKETLYSLKKSEQYVGYSEEAGQAAITSLQQQSEDLRRIDEELEGLSPMIEIAKRDLASIARRMFRDKCFIAICIAVCIALIIVIVMLIRNNVKGLTKTLGGGDNSVTPTAPPDLAPTARPAGPSLPNIPPVFTTVHDSPQPTMGTTIPSNPISSANPATEITWITEGTNETIASDNKTYASDNTTKVG